MYEVGKVHIWQNVTGSDSFLNGSETIVTREGELYLTPDGIPKFGWLTDSVNGYGLVYAWAGELRPKNPPVGERKTMELFQPKPVMGPA